MPLNGTEAALIGLLCGAGTALAITMIHDILERSGDLNGDVEFGLVAGGATASFVVPPVCIQIAEPTLASNGGRNGPYLGAFVGGLLGLPLYPFTFLGAGIGAGIGYGTTRSPGSVPQRRPASPADADAGAANPPWR